MYAIALTKPISGDQQPPTWALSLQPRKQKRLFHHQNTQTSLFTSSHTDTSTKKTNNSFTDNTVLVKLLIAENDTSAIDKRVQETLSRVCNNASYASSEQWLRDAIVALQQASLCNRFDVDAFMHMATQTLLSQQSHTDHVAIEVDYLSELQRTNSIEEMHETRNKAMEKKKGGSHFGFWVSRPEGLPKKVRRVDSWERVDDAYGGLM
jgi:hypothetical protein